MSEHPAQFDSPSAALLAPDGPIARRVVNYETRAEQIEMVRAVERTLDERSILLAEAGTGVGKSFAYLLPAIRRAVDQGERIVIATNTISLQEQLMEKDIPLLRAALPDEFTAVLVKGRGNYLSLRRLKLASERQVSLFPDDDERLSLHTIENWAYETTDGTLSTLPQIPRNDVWDRVQSDSDNCMGRRCPTYDKCFYQTARRRMESAKILICNHAIFFADLALRSADVGFLPNYDHVILDEAHNIEDVACEHFGLSLTEGRVRHLLNTLYSARRKRGVVAERGFLTALELEDGETGPLDRAIELVLAARETMKTFFESWATFAERADTNEELGRGDGKPSRTRRVHSSDVVENVLTEPMNRLALALRGLKDSVKREADRYELNAYCERAGAIAREADYFVSQTIADCVYWVESQPRTRGRGRRVRLACSPIVIAPVLREHLFNAGKSVVLTSATLTTKRGDFSHLRARLGCDEAWARGSNNDNDDDASAADEDGVEVIHVEHEDPRVVHTLLLGSPFDHGRLVRFIVEPEMPEPNHPQYVQRLVPRILYHVDETDGGAFVLFTSFAMLHRVADAVRESLEQSGHPLLVHGLDGPRSLLLHKFREDDRSVLLGTTSFWQGVDVQGRGLRNVIITRLPFEVPDLPLVQARLERIRELGGNPFRDESLPRAVIRFKQGFGRLIRSATDTGRCVVLDPRIATKPYGQSFLNALPPGIEVERLSIT